MIRSSTLRAAGWIWAFLSILVLAESFRQSIFLVPTEATMGNIQRIFYWHVTEASLGLVFPYVNLIASLAFLFYRRRDPLKSLAADALAVASAEVTILFVSIGLATGMLWGRPVWGIWWTWDARLTTYFLLWLLYVSYLLLRRLSPSGQIGTLAAVLSIFAAIDVPITFMSIEWWRTQHPAPVLRGEGHLDPSFYPAVFWSIAGWTMWGIFLIAYRFQIERRRQIDEQERALHTLEASLEIMQ